MITVNDVIRILEELSPPDMACQWDNTGLMTGERRAEVSRILVTLDVDDESIERAIAEGCDMIVSHHPLIFGKLTSVTTDSLTGRRIIRLIKNNIACYSMHTNFDICGSMGQLAADTLGLVHSRTLEVTTSLGDGLGRIADTDAKETKTVMDWAARTKEAFGIPTVKIFGDCNKIVRRVAIYPGSGREAIDIAISQGADVLITGDIGHHAGIDAKAQQLAVIDAGHYGIEHVFISFIADFLRTGINGTEIIEAEIIQPFTVI